MENLAHFIPRITSLHYLGDETSILGIGVRICLLGIKWVKQNYTNNVEPFFKQFYPDIFYHEEMKLKIKIVKFNVILKN